MSEFDASSVFNDDGSFTDTGRQSLVTHAGEEHKDTKVFDDIKDFGGMCKVLADTKSALGKKLDNVIQKPADDAGEDVKAAYKAELATASGAPNDASGYEFYKPEKLPEGMVYDQALEDKYRALFFEKRVPKDTAAALSQIFAETAINSFNTLIDADKEEQAKKTDEEQRVFDAECTRIKTKWPGEALPKNARISLAGINKFGSDELKKKLADAKMYENAADLAAWKKSGVPISTLELFYNISLETLDASVLGGGKGGAAGGGAKKSMYGRTKTQLGETS